MTNVKVGDIIGFRSWPEGSDDNQELDCFYLITKTRNRFRYDAIFLNDGETTQMEKSYVRKYGKKVA
jgi:hypothetical protein